MNEISCHFFSQLLFDDDSVIEINQEKNILIFRKLGNGAFGEVFAGRLKCDLAPDLKAGFPVAIKTLHEHSDSYQTELDFTIEAQIMAKFNHR